VSVITIEPIAYVRAARVATDDDFWGGAESRIVLTDDYEEDALAGIDDFSHVEVIFHFNRVGPADVVRGTRHPRNNQAWPRIGVFAQRGKNRPNRLGSTIARVIRREGRTLVVAELDAIDGTPVVDLKPVMQEFLPRGPVHQPQWSRELMADYWTVAK
jgi:tRNA-Thr(GGU) m(6)t(6)A37 methyltransferase TsaA